MKRGIALLLVIAACLTSGIGVAEDIWDTLADAYIYTFPLVLMDATRTVFNNTETSATNRAPVNQMSHAKKLADDKMKLVVSPNVDTLYTQAWIDVSEEPVVYRLPETERFLTVQLLDMWTNTVAILDEAGDYAVVSEGYAGELPEGVTRIETPTDTVWMIVRAVVDNDADIPRVAALQSEMRLVPLSAYGDVDGYQPPKGEYRAEDDFVPVQKVLGMTPQAYFETANRLMEKYPSPEADAEELARFEKIGVGAGLTFNVSALTGDVAEQWKAMLGGMRARLTAKSRDYASKMGIWTYFGDPIGDFGTAYEYRAMVALAGLGANPTSVAVYPKVDVDSDGDKLTGEKTYTLHMEQLPPIKDGGFWSITAYGEDDFLMANPINRFCINDRSACVYNEDGSLDIVLSKDEPENAANWLPVGEGGFHLYLRIYLPEMEKLSDWQAPEIYAR